MTAWPHDLERLEPIIRAARLPEDTHYFRAWINANPNLLEKLFEQTNRKQLFDTIKTLALPNEIKKIVDFSNFRLLGEAINRMILSEKSPLVDSFLERLLQIIKWAKLLDDIKCAVILKDIRNIIHLIEQNPQLIKVKDEHGMTALHFAASNGCLPAAIIFIQFGASLNDKGPGEASVQYYAHRQGNKFLNRLKFAEQIRNCISRLSNNSNILLKSPIKLQNESIGAPPSTKRPTMVGYNP